MTQEQVVQLVSAINQVSYSLWWTSFWLALMLFFKDMGGK